MTTRTITAIVIGAAIVGLAGYDVWAMVHAGASASISDVILQASLRRPAIPFAAGVLCGHLFFSQKG